MNGMIQPPAQPTAVQMPSDFATDRRDVSPPVLPLLTVPTHDLQRKPTGH
ncbi:MAG TPA: hypothetical protein V6C76_17770 [Drouetiella sp.]